MLLKFRLRSVKELSRRLEAKKFPPEIVRQAVTFLKEKKFLDDEAFTKAWVESRLKKPYGMRRIIQELSLKGIDKELIRAKFQAVQDYSEEDTVTEIVKNKMYTLKSVSPEKAKRRIYSYLLRRGFSPDIAINTLNSQCKQTN